jgi:tetratricopeptide (TPR) repeat protein
MSRRTKTVRPKTNSLGAHPRNHLLGIALALAVLVFFLTFPWQLHNWREANALRQEASAQQARLQQLQQAHDALSHAQDTLRAAPNDPNAHLVLAAQMQQNGNTPGAAAQLRVLEPAAMHSPDLAGAVAALYEKLGYIDRAVALARQALRLAPSSPDAYLHLGVLDMQLGWQRQGQALLNQAARALPQSAEPHLALALADNQSGAYQVAKQQLTMADRLRPGDWHIAALLADNSSAQGHDTEALQFVAEALRLAPQEPTLYAQQARILLDQARRQSPGSPPNLGPILAAVQQCLVLDPNNAGVHDTLGLAYRDAGREADARREWEQANALAPDNGTLSYNLARLRLAQGDRASGMQLLAEATRAMHDDAEYNRLVAKAGLTPDDPGPHRLLARWCQSHHHISRAIFEWQEVLAHLPKDAEARQSAAQLLKQRG